MTLQTVSKGSATTYTNGVVLTKFYSRSVNLRSSRVVTRLKCLACWSSCTHRQPGVEVTVGGVTCLKKSVYMSGLLVIGTSSICGGATTHNNRDGFAGNPRMMDPFSNSTFCKSLSYKHNAKSGVARDGGKSSIYGPFSSRYPN